MLSFCTGGYHWLRVKWIESVLQFTSIFKWTSMACHQHCMLQGYMCVPQTLPLLFWKYGPTHSFTRDFTSRVNVSVITHWFHFLNPPGLQGAHVLWVTFIIQLLISETSLAFTVLPSNTKYFNIWGQGNSRKSPWKRNCLAFSILKASYLK